jgi:deoxycytidylate deaminase
MTQRKKYQITATTFCSKGRVICTRSNDYLKSHPLQKHYSLKAGLHQERCWLHAEMSALIASRGTQVHSILIQRFDVQGKMKLAKPCPSCFLAIKEFNVQEIRYTSDIGIQLIRVRDGLIKSTHI